MKAKFYVPIAAIGLACAPGLAMAAERPTGGRNQAAYLACYREVLEQPQFASLDPAGRYAAATSVADEVMSRCEKHIRALRNKLLGGSERSQEQALREGGTRLPDGMRVGIVDALLRAKIADDLAEADPRVKPIADADPKNQWRRGAATH